MTPVCSENLDSQFETDEAELEVPDGILDHVLDTLRINDLNVRKSLRQELNSAAGEYLEAKRIEQYFGAPGPQKKLIRQLSVTLNKAYIISNQLYPEYLSQLSFMAARELDDDLSVFSSLDEILAGYLGAARVFAENYRPRANRPTNLNLEEAVGRMLKATEGATGGQALFQQSKHRGESAKPCTPESEAICLLLRAINPRLPIITIANMIDKVRADPEPREHHLLTV
ncbi:MAG: hypothetical protein ABIT68_01580, partial [Sphingomicrobium sp.]